MNSKTKMVAPQTGKVKKQQRVLKVQEEKKDCVDFLDEDMRQIDKFLLDADKHDDNEYASQYPSQTQKKLKLATESAKKQY